MATVIDFPASRARPTDLDAGDRLLNDVFDLVTRRLPELEVDDPVRRRFAAILPQLARNLGRRLPELEGKA
jgi:hypothetical protein